MLYGFSYIAEHLISRGMSFCIIDFMKPIHIYINTCDFTIFQ